jgi:Uncharacterized protein conserved in bacteria (DUF2125)
MAYSAVATALRRIFIRKGIVMTKLSLAGSTALTVFLFAASAQAQVTPEEVWKSWQDLSAGMGQTMAATSEARDGDTLVVEGVTMTMNAPDGTAAEAVMGTIRFRETGSGTVEVTLPDSYPMSMTLAPPESSASDGPVTIKMTISQPGIAITAGGSPTETSYDFTAPTFGVAVTEISNATGPQDVKIDVAMTDIVGKYLMVGDATTKSIDASYSAATAMVNLTGTEDGNTFAASFSTADVTGSSKGNFLGAEMMANVATALNAGFAANGTLAYGKTAFDLDVTESGSNTKVSGTMDSGNFDFGMDKTRLKYAIGVMGADLTVSGAEIPVPQVNVSYGEFAFNLNMPVSKSDVPQDFAFLTKLVDFKVSDDIWAMFDPTAQLPRDPATIIIDTKGTATLKQDIMDPTLAGAMESAAPGDLNTLDVTELRAKVGGAEIAGVGAFVFDNTDLTTFQGMPAPTGKLEVTLTGINALLDTLVAMGFIPEDQVMGARMMLAMFAKPGDGPDTLVSTIEFKDKGLYANGQRLQ